MTNQEFVESLRALADFYEAHPALKPAHSMSNRDITIYANGKDEMAQCARQFGNCEKTSDDIFFRVIRNEKLGLFRLSAIEYRSQVCERVVTGKRVIPAEVVPAHTVPEREEEIVEWRCPDSLLENADVS